MCCHVGILGATCIQTTHFDSGFSSESYADTASSAATDSSDYSGSVSGGGSDFGYSASFSSSYSHASSNSYTNEASVNNASSYSASYTSTTSYCSGAVYLTDECGGMFSRQNAPALIEHEMLPIWDINLTSKVSDALIKTTVELLAAGKLLCGGMLSYK